MPKACQTASPEPHTGPVIREWMFQLTYKEQTVLLSALRGCDGIQKEDISKKLTRALRGVLLYDGCPPGTDCDFMRPCNVAVVSWEFVKSVDHYPVHWLMHFAHATEIVGYKHPDYNTRVEWNVVYRRIVEALHLKMETIEEMEKRLG